MTRILFQLNLAKMRAPFDDPIWDDFKTRLGELHEYARSFPGYIGRYQGEKSEAGYIIPYPGEPLIMGNMSWWTNYDDLFRYTFTGPHLLMMRNKRKWFDKLPQPYNVLYYGNEKDFNQPHKELLEEAKRRLGYLRTHGETSISFGFGSHRGKL